jgi:hypothetical protein
VDKSGDNLENSTGGSTWFDLMTGYLKWKVIGPDIQNPFKTPQTLANLHRMLTQRDFLCQHVSVRCMCDGYEVMMIVNPNLPRIVSNHPCINTMPLGDIIDYLQRNNLDDFIEKELERIQVEIREHIEERKKSAALDLQTRDSETRGLLTGKKEGGQDRSGAKGSENTASANKSSAGKSGNRNYRILKR